MSEEDFARANAAAKLIATDGIDGYHTTATHFGEPVANALLVAHLRRIFNPGDRYPEPAGLAARIKNLLRSQGLLI